MEAILDDKFCNIDAFLGAGHVCTIMGTCEYFPLAEKYKIPIVVSGFEPADLLQAIYHAVLQLEKGEHKVENCYERLVKDEGNVRSKSGKRNFLKSELKNGAELAKFQILA